MLLEVSSSKAFTKAKTTLAGAFGRRSDLVLLSGRPELRLIYK